MVDNSTDNWRAGKIGGCGFSTGSFGNSCLTCNDGQAKSAVVGSPQDPLEILTAHKNSE